MSEKTIKINEQVVTQEEFEKKKEEVENMPNAQLVERKPGEYRIKLHD